MPYRAPTSDNFNHAKWLRWGHHLGPIFDPFLETMTEQIQAQAGEEFRSDRLRNVTNALSVILANIYSTHLRDQNRYIVVDRSNDAYKTGSYNPIGLNIRAIRDSINYMIDSDPKLVEQKGGNYDPTVGTGYPTRVRATELLINQIEEYLFNKAEDQEKGSGGIIRNTLRDNPQSISLSFLFKDEELPLVRLRGEKTEMRSAPLLEFEPNEETVRMEGNLSAYNRFLVDHHWIDLLIPDQEFQALSRDTNGDPDEFGDEDDGRWELDILGRNQLYRVFNNGRFTDGGRFYGGWWQGVPSRLRRHLTINWFPTAELDYSNMQIAMLYADEGLQLQGDAYAIPGIPDTHRKLIKRTVFKIINAPGQIRAPRIAELPEGWNWRQIMEAVREKHRPIAHFFGTGEGIRLQKRDADIAEDVMLTMMAEGTLVLPIHDSFVVEEGRQHRLREVMSDAYRRHLGPDIDIDANPTWFGDLPEEIHEMEQLDVRGPEDLLSEQEMLPEYANYRRRRDDYLRFRGEKWGHDHHFHA